jgi:hypothetical protein
MEKQIDLPFYHGRYPEPELREQHLAMLGVFCLGMGLPEWIDHHMPKPGSGAGYNASTYVLPLMLMLVKGGRSLEDIRLVKDDRLLCKILKLARVPSPDAIGDWLRRSSTGEGLRGLAQVNRLLIKRALSYDGHKDYTLDIFAMMIAAEKASAKLTHGGHRGYWPLVACLQDPRLVLGDAFREGDVTPNAGLTPLIKDCARQIPAGSNLKALRAAGPFDWPAEVFSPDIQTGMNLTVGIAPDAAILHAIETLPESEWTTYQSGRLAQFAYQETLSHTQVQLVVERRPYQAALFEEPDDTARYQVVANQPATSAETVMTQYSEHCTCSRTRIQTLKTAFALERMPCGQTGANAVFFRIGTIAHNIYQLFTSRITALSEETAPGAIAV